MKKISYSLAGWILIFAVGAETAFDSFFTVNNLELINYYSVAYFILGLLIATLPMIRYSPVLSNRDKNWQLIAKRILIGVIFFSAVFYSIQHVYWVFKMLPIDYRSADMIPQIIISCTRWMHHIYVYQPIPEIWNGLLPSYLPLMWMPYSPLLLLGADVRWTTVIFYLAGMALLLWMLARYARVNWMQLFLILFFLCYLIFIQTDYNRFFFAWTEEGLVVFYYLLLGYGLTKNNVLIIALGITACLLSRYSLFFWIPAFLTFQFFALDKRKALIESTIIFLTVLVIFILPFFIKDPEYFLTLPSKYSALTTRTWTYETNLISRGLGFAKFFSVTQISFLHYLQLALAGIIPVAFYCTIYFLRRKNFINILFAGLCGLKLTLVFFYNFLEVPYFYLFYVNTLFSYVILIHFLNPDSQKSTSLLLRNSSSVRTSDV